MPRYKEKDEKEKVAPATVQKTAITAKPVAHTQDAVDHSKRAAADEAAARGQAAIDKEKAGGIAKQTGRAQAKDDGDPEPQAKDYKSLPEFASARRAWLAKRKAKADAQKEAMK